MPVVLNQNQMPTNPKVGDTVVSADTNEVVIWTGEENGWMLLQAAPGSETPQTPEDSEPSKNLWDHLKE